MAVFATGKTNRSWKQGWKFTGVKAAIESSSSHKGGGVTWQKGFGKEKTPRSQKMGVSETLKNLGKSAAQGYKSNSLKKTVEQV